MKQKALITSILILILSGTAFNCSRTIDTNYSLNKKSDKTNPISQEQFIASIGKDKYDQLISGIGKENLDLLQYGAGNSNMIDIINNIDINRLVQLLTGTRALGASDVLSLMNRLDSHLAKGFTHANGSVDTIGKMVNIIQGIPVTGMQAIKDLIKGTLTNASGAMGTASTPAMNDRFDRLTYLLATMDETSITAGITGIMPALVTQVMLMPDQTTINTTGRDNLLRFINESIDVRKLSTIIGGIEAVTGLPNISNLLLALENKGQCETGGVGLSYFDCIYDTASNSQTGRRWIQCYNEAVFTTIAATFTSEATCAAAGKFWRANGIEVMVRTVSQIGDATKLSSLVNNLLPTPPTVPNSENDNNFETAATACGTLTKTYIDSPAYAVSKMTSGSNVNLDSWYINGGDVPVGGGACSLHSDTTLGHNEVAATEITSNILTPGNITFSYKVNSQGPSAVSKITLLTSGTGYTSTPSVTISGGGGTGATATAVVSQGVVNSLTLTSGGSGYSSNPTVSFTGGGGAGATAIITRTSVGISNLTLTNGGLNYTAPPQVIFSGGGGTGGLATANLSAQSLTSITLTSGGTNYTSIPAVSISGGGGTGATAIANIPVNYGKLKTLTLGAKGSGYTWASVSFTGGGGTGATASATIGKAVNNAWKGASGGSCPSNLSASVVGGGGSGATVGVSMSSYSCNCVLWICSTCYRVNNVWLTAGGNDYTSTPSVSFSSGCGATAGASLAPTGRVKSITLTNAGLSHSYTSAPTVTISGNGAGATATVQVDSGPVTSFTLTGGGINYTNVPTLTVTGGGGSGAAGTPIAFHTITSLTLNNPGSYTSTPTVAFFGGGGSGGVATATVPTSSIQSITITGGGSGYTTAPTVSITGGGGTGAGATSTVSGTGITKINITNPGSGYTTSPTVSITGGGGTGATAQAFVSGDYFKFYLDNVLKVAKGGALGWATASIPVGIGIHRMRFEFSKDASITTGTNGAFVDNIVIPGTAGAGRYPYDKVAILMNTVTNAASNRIAQLLDGLASPSVDPSDIQNMAGLMNKVEYPTSPTATPRLVSVINDVNAISTMVSLIRNLNNVAPNDGVNNLVATINYVDNIKKVTELVNNLAAGDPGLKLANTLSPLSGVGRNAMVKVISGLSLGVNNQLDSFDEFQEIITLIDGVNSTIYLPDMMNKLVISGNQPTTVGNSSGETGGEKMASMLKEVQLKSVATGDNVTCNTNINSFCTKNHLVRLINDIAGFGSAGNVGIIISTIDAQISPTGMNRMVNIMSDLKNQNLGSKYIAANQLGNSDAFGRLTTFINALGSNGAYRVGGLINKVNNTGNLSYLMLQADRVAYMSDMLNDLTSEDLMVDLLNDGNTLITRIETVVDIMGNASYNPTGNAPIPRYGAGFTPKTADTNTGDPLGRLIHFINDVSGNGISNVIRLINGVNDLYYMTNLIRNVQQVRFLSDTTNKVINIDLMIKIFNGLGTVGICSPGDQYMNQTTCTTSAKIWSATLNRCLPGGSYTNKTSCTASGNVWTGVILPRMLDVLDKIGVSTVYGGVAGAKTVGNMDMLAGVINELGYKNGIKRADSEQVKVVKLMNGVEYCGLKPSSDLSVTFGPTCSNANYINRIACLNAGFTWQSNDMYNCDNWRTFANYNNTTEINDKRPRMVTVVLGLNNAKAMATITADVTDTQKTLNMMNGVRKINTIIDVVNLMPGEVAARLINDAELPAIFRSFVYMTNNLDPDERVAAQAFASMIHYGTGIRDSTSRNVDNTCRYFTGIGPHRIAQLMNAEVGSFLEAVILMTGWRTSIPAMTCGMGSPSAGTPQYMGRDYPSNPMPVATGQWLARTESITTSVGNFTYQHSGGAACLGYYPEQSSGGVWPCTISAANDKVIWQGSGACGVNIAPGLTGLWDILKGRGIVAWMLDTMGGTIGTPPTFDCGANCTTNPSCYGGAGPEWNCIKAGIRNGNMATSSRWGNYCSTPGYFANGATCAASGGRWMPYKNYTGCRVDPFIHQPVQSATGFTRLAK